MSTVEEHRRGILRELLIRGGTMTAPPMDAETAEGLGLLTRHDQVRQDGHTLRLVNPPRVQDLADTDDRATALLVMQRVLIAAEGKPHGIGDGAGQLAELLGDKQRAARVHRAAMAALTEDGIAAVAGGRVTDTSGPLHRQGRPATLPTVTALEPKWAVQAPAPLPTPSGTGHGEPHGAPTVEPEPATSTPTPVELEPTAPKPATVEKRVETVTEQVAAPVVDKPKPVAAPNPDITAALTRLAVAAERQAEVLGMVVAEGRLEPSVQREEDAARDALARRICVLIGAHGSMRHGQLTAKHLSHAQRDVSWAATSYAVGLGALRKDAGNYVLGDVSRLGWTAEGYAAAVKEQVDKRLRLTQQREARRREQREADAANAAIARARDEVVGRTT